jgi:hypothetical protein
MQVGRRFPLTSSLVVPARSSLPTLAFVTFVAALALVGGALAVAAFTAADDRAGEPHAAAVGEPIATSYGSITVVQVGTIGGLAAQDLGGMTHGIQSLVGPDEAQVSVAILLVNRSDRPVRVEPGQFRLTVEGSTDPVVPTGSTIRPLVLRPGASVEASLAFVVPQTGARVSVAYADPGGPSVTVPAGQLGEAPADDPAHVDDPAHADEGSTP